MRTSALPLGDVAGDLAGDRLAVGCDGEPVRDRRAEIVELDHVDSLTRPEILEHGRVWLMHCQEEAARRLEWGVRKAHFKSA